MIYRCLILMLCCSLAFAKVVGLTGGSAADSGNACFFDPDQRTVADAVEANGAYKYTKADCVVVNDGQIQIQVTEGQGSASWVGLWVAITSSDQTSFDGLHEILSVDTGANPDTFNIDEAWTDQTNCNIVIGGAVPIVDVAGYDLQDILDHATSSAAVQNVDILLVGTGTLTAGVVADTGDGSVDTRKRIIGVNTSYVNDGTQATLDGNGAVATCLILDGDYMGIENMILTNSTAHTLQVGAGTYYNHYAVNNCKADSTVNHAVETNRAGGLFVNCDFRTTHGSSSAVQDFAGTMKFDTCYLETASTTTHCANMQRPGGAENTIFVGGTYGLDTAFNSSVLSVLSIRNCSFYNQVTSCVNIAGNNSGISISNNLFWVADKANDYAVTIADAGTLLFADFNFTNIETAHYPMLLNSVELDWQGVNSGDNLWSDTETNLWTDAANDDLTVVDAAMIDGGMPTLSDEGGTPADGYTTPGAAQLAQTQAGGGIFPQRIERRGD